MFSLGVLDSHASTARFSNATGDNGPNRFNREVILATSILTLITLKDDHIPYPWTLSMRFEEVDDIELDPRRLTLPIQVSDVRTRIGSH